MSKQKCDSPNRQAVTQSFSDRYGVTLPKPGARLILNLASGPAVFEMPPHEAVWKSKPNDGSR